MVPMARIERAASPLPRECSTTELHGPLATTQLTAARPSWNSIPGAGEGNRTLVVSLEGFCSTIELHPPVCTRTIRTGPPATPLGARMRHFALPAASNALLARTSPTPAVRRSVPGDPDQREPTGQLQSDRAKPPVESTGRIRPAEPTGAIPPAHGWSGALVEGEGFEPSKAWPADLQSAPFDRSGTPPNETRDCGDSTAYCQMGFRTYSAGCG